MKRGRRVGRRSSRGGGFSIMGVFKSLFSVKGLIGGAIVTLIVFVVGGSVKGFFESTATKVSGITGGNKPKTT